MKHIKEKDDLKKDLRLLIASSLLWVMVYIKDFSWAWLDSTLFWTIALSLILYCIFLVAWLLTSIYQWGKAGFEARYAPWIYLITAGLLLSAVYAMR